LKIELYNKPFFLAFLAIILSFLFTGFHISLISLPVEILAISIVSAIYTFKHKDKISNFIKFKFALYFAALILVKQLYLLIFPYDTMTIAQLDSPFALIDIALNIFSLIMLFWFTVIVTFIALMLTNLVFLALNNWISKNQSDPIVVLVINQLNAVRKRLKNKPFKAISVILLVLLILIPNLIPRFNVFVRAGRLKDIRFRYSGTLLPDGNILIAGGTSNSSDFNRITSIVIYDTKSSKFIKSGNMKEARYDHTATLLKDNRILLTGGYGESGELNSAEVYNYKTKKSYKLPNMKYGRHEHAATMLSNGRVFIIGGHQDKYYYGDRQKTETESAEIFNPITNTFITTPKSNFLYDRYPLLVTLRNGKVFIAGGRKLRAQYDNQYYAEIYDPKKNSFTVIGKMIQPHQYGTVTLLKDDKVLLTGGLISQNTVSKYAEIYDPLKNKFISTEELNVNRYFHTATLLPDGKVLIAGGKSKDDYLPLNKGMRDLKTFETVSAEIYNPAKGSFYRISDMKTPRSLHLAVSVPSGAVFLFGGFNKILSIEKYLYREN